MGFSGGENSLNAYWRDLICILRLTSTLLLLETEVLYEDNSSSYGTGAVTRTSFHQTLVNLQQEVKKHVLSKHVK